jgi:hypothetical protein
MPSSFRVECLSRIFLKKAMCGLCELLQTDRSRFVIFITSIVRQRIWKGQFSGRNCGVQHGRSLSLFEVL